MSWSVSATGKAGDIAPHLASQIAAVKLSDAGEMETVRNVGVLLAQTLGTFDPAKLVKVSASGSMGYRDWGIKNDAFQQVSITIEPIHLTT